MTAKRYTPAEATKLLVRLLDALDANRRTEMPGIESEIEIPISDRSTRKMRSALVDLLEARFGEIRVSKAVVENLRGQSPWMIRSSWLAPVNGVVAGPQFPGQDLKITVRSLRVSEQDTAIEIEGPLGHIIALQAITLVRMVGREKILTCDCGRKFVKIGKRRYCSERCQKRVYMREFREV